MQQAIATIPKGRARLTQVLRRAGDVLSISDVSEALRIGRLRAAKLLAGWDG
jgi:hypothetical protein